jgi:two-component system cell cycle response regulator
MKASDTAHPLGGSPFPWSLAGRVALRMVPAVAVLAAFFWLARGGFARFDRIGAAEGVSVALLLGGLALSFARRARGRTAGLRDDLELGSASIALAYLVVAVVGSPVFPLVYLLVAFLMSWLPRASGLTLLGVALVFEAVTQLAVRPATFAVHACFLLLFGGLYHLVLAARLQAARRAESEAVANRIKEAEERARTFRLVSAGSNDSQSGLKDHEKWLLASVKEIEGTVGIALETAELALKTQTCAVFLIGADDRWLKLHDCRSQFDAVERERIPAGEGILGGVIKRGVPVRMHARDGLKGITWYQEGSPLVGALLAVPIVENERVRGVMLAERRAAEPFTEREEKLLCTLASEVRRSIEVERVMGYIRKTRDEKDRFFRAIEELNRAGSPEQVFQAAMESARVLAGLDFCAVTLVSEVDGKREHKIARLAGVTQPANALEGRTFADNNGLVANVIRYGAPLPGRDVRAMDRQVIFDADTQVRGLAALKILPLTAGDRILGTLVAGSRNRSDLDDEALRMLEVIASQAAQALLRAQLFEQMEKMAITDGLTGLLNHRTFQARAEEALAQAKRYGRRCSLILTDIDHFNSVNDTYGHPTGDLVLKGVAKILREQARDTDVVARYGGEEFAIVMPETDLKGALVIAERIREAVQAQVFSSEVGPIKVTLSLGVATCPDHGAEKQGLIDLADQCLYFAKRHGRNRSVTVNQLQAPRTRGMLADDPSGSNRKAV